MTAVIDDVVRANYAVDEIIAACSSNPPVMVVIDPAVSFGVGESRVNDAEQGLIEAGRRLRNALNCCVLFIHHTGKMNAREKTLDQYSGRGGSALADGCRMVAVMQPCDEAEWREATGSGFHAGESGLVIARPKLSYAPRPDQHIYIVRRGFMFERVSLPPANPAAAMQARCNQVWQFISCEAAAGRRHNRKGLEDMLPALNMKRDELRYSISVLISSGRVAEQDQKEPGKRGAPAKYLTVVDLTNCSPDVTGEQMEISE